MKAIILRKIDRTIDRMDVQQVERYLDVLDKIAPMGIKADDPKKFAKSCIDIIDS